MTAGASDLRTWLDLLDGRGELARLKHPIDPDQDVAAVLERADGRRAVRFDDVAGAEFPLVGNTVVSREQLGLALGCGPHEVADRFAAALDAPRPCRQVDRDAAPVLANRLTGERLLSALPLTRQHEHDGGMYLTSALLAVRDPASGTMNLSINRLLAAGERELRALLLPGRLRRIFTEAEAAGRDLDVALVVGVHPTLVLASQSPADRELDDLEVASALAAEPLDLVAAPTVDALVPAGAEFVLEGRFRAGRREAEGPFGEYPRTYGPGGPAPVIDLIDAWHRGDAVFQTILSGGREHFYAGGLPREAMCLRALRRAGLDVAGLRLPESGSCRLAAVVALRNPAPGAATTAMLTLFLTAATIKQVTVVDDDVDVLDDEQIGWAVATRVQADRDLLVVPGAKGSSLDPSATGALTAKLGVDATVPADDREKYRQMRVSPADPERVRAHLAELGL
ncbi:UbiD family decarboxylase [Pseudonocardia bannensis]|uniref:UbiD family decarboxylase n=1 Tax=Pseudonocardia bannensis TaxID=630973 RepID=A0A848DGN4_9PSEU|nr:UbiD family decarboxylase [Pseudonocardia bannensis]NMH91715.1 UbiD family decarboxylase [Pseudonocardia bannensis]